MKVTLIHGSYVEASKKRYFYILEAIKKRGWEIVHIEKGRLTALEALTGSSLFETDKLFVLEDLDLLSKKEFDWLVQNASRLEVNLLLYKSGEATKKHLDLALKYGKEEKFSLPQTVFQFLDSFVPKNTRICLRLLHQVIQNEPIELVFALLVTHLRDLYWVKTAPNTISVPPWRLQKLKKQSQSFSENQLRQYIGNLADIDTKVKLSQDELRRSLDLFIVAALQ